MSKVERLGVAVLGIVLLIVLVAFWWQLYTAPLVQELNGIVFTRAAGAGQTAVYEFDLTHSPKP